jgi:predicted transcriptional regulator of viral defense system
MNKQELAGLSTQERKIVSYFSAKEENTITADKLIDFHPYKRATANQILRRLALKGWLQRLKYGVYAIVPISSTTATPTIENAWLVAMDLFNPAFISGWSAAEHWDLTEQIFNNVSVSTMSAQRESTQLFGNVNFRTKLLGKEQFFGIKKIWFGSKAIEIADPSRMLIDILDLPRFGGGGRHMVDVVRQYWNTDVCNPDLLLEYALRYKRGVVFKRLGFLAETLKAPISEEWINICQINISKGISYLDPDGPKKGKIISKWRLKINLPI